MQLASDPAIRAFLRTHLRPGECALDVGANQGLHTATLADCVGPTGTVHAFEANPDVAAGLIRRFQGMGNVRIHPVAVSDDAAVLTFYMDIRQGLGGVASSLEVLHDLHATGQAKPVTVQAITLDDFCARHDLKPRLIKIDVEGHELKVIRGAARTIATHRPLLIFEFWETWWDRGVRHIFDYLKPGYTLTRLQDGVNVEEFYYHNRGEGTVDIACVPRAESRARDHGLDARRLTVRAA
jgi:FkbM family methyltransferase